MPDAYLIDFPAVGTVISAPPRTFTSAATLGEAELGIDAACITDITNTMTLASGLINLGMALCRRLITPRGALFYDPDYGKDLRELLNADVTDSEIAAQPDEIRSEVEKDERVQSCTVDVAFNRAAASMTIKIRGVTAVGPFGLIIGVSQVTVELLGLFDPVGGAAL